MKKNFIYAMMAVLMGLFASCSQEEMTDARNSKGNLVSISADIPAEFANTRALPSAGNNAYQLRCILEIWSKGASAELIFREEKLETAASNGKISFELPLDNGNYDCLLWADFVQKGAALTDGHYADTFYQTTDLSNVNIIDASMLFNTDACDAFFASQELVKTEQDGVQLFSATLTRPFSKLTVYEKNKTSFAKCKSVSASYKVPAGFNVKEGSVSSELVESTLTDGTVLGAGETDLRLFSCYAFAEQTGVYGQVTLTFKGDAGAVLRETAIPANLPANRNVRTNAKGHLVAEAQNNTGVDVEFNPDWTNPDEEEEVAPEVPVEDVKVGSFYYSDGTWSAALKADKECIGIVFAVGMEKTDAIANYGATFADNNIKGYVVAVKDAAEAPVKFGSSTMSTGIAGVSDKFMEYFGYPNTKTITALAGATAEAYPAAFACMNMEPKPAISVTTSGWYLPVNGQLKVIRTLNEDESGAFKKNLKQLVDAGKGSLFSTGDGTSANYWSSSVAASGKVYRYQFCTTATDYAKDSNASNANTGFYVRAVLTF